MAKSDNIQAHTDKYSLVGALDPDTGEINPVRVGDTTVLGLATQLYVWNTSTLVWDHHQRSINPRHNRPFNQ
jgi:hypothetical protein